MAILSGGIHASGGLEQLVAHVRDLSTQHGAHGVHLLAVHDSVHSLRTGQAVCRRGVGQVEGDLHLPGTLRLRREAVEVPSRRPHVPDVNREILQNSAIFAINN